MAFPQQSSKVKQDSLMFVMVRSDQDKYPVWNWGPLLRLSLWPEDHFERHFRVSLTTDYVRSQQDEAIPSELDSPLVRPPPHELAATWLAKCMTNEAGRHVACQRHNSGYLPTRLLDVRYALQSSRLRLVYSKDDQASPLTKRKYATLSHCWGLLGAAENPNLTEANLETRKMNGLNCDTLPATFFDALQVCSWLRSKLHLSTYQDVIW